MSEIKKVDVIPFKIGDEVECINKLYKVEYGRVYLVQKISTSKGLISLKDIEYEDNIPIWYNPKHFKLKRRSLYRVGDKIRCTFKGAELLTVNAVYIVSRIINPSQVRLQGDFRVEDHSYYNSQQAFPNYYFAPIKRRLNKNRKPMTNVQEMGDNLATGLTKKSLKRQDYRTNYSDQEKIDAVTAYMTGKKTTVQLADEMNIHFSTVYTWKKKFFQETKKPDIFLLKGTDITVKETIGKPIKKSTFKETAKRPPKGLSISPKRDTEIETVDYIPASKNYMEQLNLTESDLNEGITKYDILQEKMRLEKNTRQLKLDITQLKVFLFNQITAIDKRIKEQEDQLANLTDKVNE